MKALDRDKLKARLAALAPEQRALLLRQLKAKGMDLEGFGLDVTVAQPEDDSRHSLSPSQEQVFLAEQINPGTSAYHIAFQWRIQGQLNLDALEKSLTILVQRHQAFRLSFHHDLSLQDPSFKDTGFQKLNTGVSLKVCSETVQEHQLEQRVQRIAREPFDLSKAPLCRVHHLQPDNRLVFVWHHLIADGWSRGVFLSELNQVYTALCEDSTSEAPALPDSASYLSFITAQKQWLQSEQCQPHLAYWQNKLQGLPELTPILPTASPAISAAGNSVTLTRTLPESLRQSLHTMARQLNVTPFVLLLTGFNMLLHRYSGKQDITLGIPVAGRALGNNAYDPDVSATLGFFVNTLVIRTQPVNPYSIESWLNSVKHSLAEAFDHQSIPLATVMEKAGRKDLFNTMFQYQNLAYGKQNASRMTDGLGGLEVEQEWIALDHTKFDLSVHAIERDNGLLLAVEFRTDCYQRQLIDRLMGHYQQLLQSWIQLSVHGSHASSSLHTVDELALLTDTENLQLSGWQQSAIGSQIINGLSVLDLFREQVQQCPDDCAVSSKEESLTYQQLDLQSDQVAAQLQQQGIYTDALVGLLLPRTPDLLIGLLGILKAGAAYVPLEPELPAARLGYLISDSGINTIVSNVTSKNTFLNQVAHSELVFLDVKQECPYPFRPVSVNPQQLAYCIYTSGSTGKPKGTLLTHAGLSHYLDWCLHKYPISEGRGSVVNSSIGFDATITGLLAPLLCGRTVHLLQDSTSLTSLAESLEGGFSIVKLTPAHLSALQPLMQVRLTQQPPLDPRNLPKAFIIGGEALTWAHIRFWQEHFPAIQLINEYGPTETVVGCAYYRVSEKDNGNMPIGVPIDGAGLYVLDQYLQPVPAGVTGELYIAGNGMARGYLNKPLLSAERFLPDPFASNRNRPGAVMYRSGDLAQWRDDGQLLFLGRADSQLSLRGYRIEPGEVESALCRMTEVQDAVVDVVDNLLVAYVCFQQEPDNHSDWFQSVRRTLKHQLPAYMVPARCIALKSIPLTGNGKVDRNALPKPGSTHGRNGPGEEGVDNLSKAQQILLSAWQSVLNQSEISIHDNFFDLGGDSVIAMQIVAHVHQQGYQIKPASLFEHQTVATQAEHLISQESPSEGNQQATVHTPATGKLDGRFLSAIQQDFLNQVETGLQPYPNHYNQSVLLDVVPDLDEDALYSALQCLTQRHDSLRMRFQHSDADKQWHIHFAELPCTVPLDVIQIDESIENTSSYESRLQQSISQLQSSLDLEEGPLFKACLFKTRENSKQLALIAHHLILDGVSWRLLVSDLSIRYEKAVQGAPPETGVLPLPASRWVEYLDNQLPAFKNELEYWQSIVVSSESVQSKFPHSSFPLSTVTVSEQVLTEAESTQIQSGKPTPLDAILITALAQTLCAWYGESSVLLDLEFHGRQLAGHSDLDAAPDPSMTVGWFTACYPVRIQPGQGAPVQQLLSVKQQLDSVPGKGIGYGVLRKNGLIRNDSGSQVLFNYLGNTDISTSANVSTSINTNAASLIQGMSSIEVPAQQHPQSAVRYPLNVVAYLAKGKLHVRWQFSDRALQADSVQMLQQQFRLNLLSLRSRSSEPVTNSKKASPANPKSSTASAARSLLSKLKSS